jgi:hypothetical protein
LNVSSLRTCDDADDVSSKNTKASIALPDNFFSINAVSIMYYNSTIKIGESFIQTR